MAILGRTLRKARVPGIKHQIFRPLHIPMEQKSRQI